MIQTVIFDMDGVIVDTEPVHHYAYHQHFKLLNIDISPEMYATFTGNSTKNIYQKLKDNFGLEEEVQTLVQAKRNLFNDAFDSKSDLYLLEGVEDLTKELFTNGSTSKLNLILFFPSPPQGMDSSSVMFIKFKKFS